MSTKDCVEFDLAVVHQKFSERMAGDTCHGMTLKIFKIVIYDLKGGVF
jgi:hypothetical protein